MRMGSGTAPSGAVNKERPHTRDLQRSTLNCNAPHVAPSSVFSSVEAKDSMGTGPWRLKPARACRLPVLVASGPCWECHVRMDARSGQHWGE